MNSVEMSALARWTHCMNAVDAAWWSLDGKTHQHWAGGSPFLVNGWCELGELVMVMVMHCFAVLWGKFHQRWTGLVKVVGSRNFTVNYNIWCSFLIQTPLTFSIQKPTAASRYCSLVEIPQLWPSTVINRTISWFSSSYLWSGHSWAITATENHHFP